MENLELYHWGVRGMKWGVRRYQNKDGSLTPAGQKRYNKEMEKLKKETAKVKAAEKIAANNKKVQSKFDKLDEKKQALEARKKALKNGDKPEEAKNKKNGETPEEKKDRLLKSTDAKELYDNKDLFTTAELNDRLNRIDTEARLKSKIVVEHKKTGMDYVDGLRNKIDKGVGLYKSVDKAYSEVANSAIGKTLAKKLGLEPPRQEFNMREALRRRNRMSNQEIIDLNRRLTAENSINRQVEELNRNNSNGTP